MSEATRSAALLHATAVHAGDGHEAVLVAAKKFDAFLTAGTATETAAAKPAITKPAATKPATTKPAGKTKPAPTDDADEEAVVGKATRRAAADAEAADEGEEGAGGGEEGEVTLEQVETSIADLLGAKLRKQAVALLAEYGAKSASGVKEEDRAEFVQRASDLLLGS
jgi:hypothetical protein